MSLHTHVHNNYFIAISDNNNPHYLEEIINGVNCIVAQNNNICANISSGSVHESIYHNDNFEEERMRQTCVLLVENIDNQCLHNQYISSHIIKTCTKRDFIEICFAKVGITIVWMGEGINEVGRDRKTDKIVVKVNTNF